MNKLTRISATVASSLALVAGFAGVAGAATIDHTGFSSNNQIRHRTIVRTHVVNDNDIHTTINNPQTATSGDIHASRNTSAGDVETGMAHNDSLVDATVNVDNSAATQAALSMGGGGSGDDWNASISTTGAESNNEISSRNITRTTVRNDNDVHFTVNNPQTATTGDATVNRNTTVGSVRTGDAMNVSTVMLDLSFTN